MKRKLSVATLSACAALASASAQEPTPQPEQHVIASPNPTIDDSRTTDAPGKISAAKVQPAATVNAAPFKQKTAVRKRRHKRRP